MIRSLIFLLILTGIASCSNPDAQTSVEKAEKWVRKISYKFYGTEEIHGYGYGQDEDQGQLGAWYVMSSLGLFDVKGLVETEPSFQFTSPLFDKIEIATGCWGNRIIITTSL